MLAVKATSKPGDWKMASGSAIAFEPPAAKKPMGRRMSPTPVATPIQRRTPARAGSARPRLTRRTQRPSPPSPTVTRGPWTAELMRPMAKGSWRSPTPSSEMTPTASATLLAPAARVRQLWWSRKAAGMAASAARPMSASFVRPSGVHCSVPPDTIPGASNVKNRSRKTVPSAASAPLARADIPPYAASRSMVVVGGYVEPPLSFISVPPWICPDSLPPLFVTCALPSRCCPGAYPSPAGPSDACKQLGLLGLELACRHPPRRAQLGQLTEHAERIGTSPVRPWCGLRDCCWRRGLDADVDDRLEARLERREGRRHDECREHDRGIRALAGDCHEEPLRQRDRGGVDAGKNSGQGAVDEGPIDDHVDLVEAVAQDGDGDGSGREESGRDEEQLPEEDPREPGRRAEPKEENGISDPLELLAFVAARAPEAHDGGRDRDTYRRKLEDVADRHAWADPLEVGSGVLGRRQRPEGLHCD